jgi:hypothetical protein
MRAATIAKLAWYKPRSGDTTGLSNSVTNSGLAEEQLQDILHYAECYKNLQFGWDIAQSLVESNIPFPSFLEGDDLYIWRAYNYITGNEDPTIAGALALTNKSNTQTAATIKALLISKDVTHTYVAHKTSIPVEVIIAYEKLFFNVLDRKKDHAYIASIVYPNGRMVEAMENYLEETGIGDLMLRAGHNKGTDHVLYASGLGDNPFAKADVAEGATMLDSMFMADGCLYAGLGWLHQRRNAMPITNARLSIQAGKMGKGEQQTNTSFLGIGETLRNEIITVGQYKAEAQRRAEVLDIVPEIPVNATEQTM